MRSLARPRPRTTLMAARRREWARSSRPAGTRRLARCRGPTGPSVNRSSPWTTAGARGLPAGFVLVAFACAAAIRDAWLRSGNGRPARRGSLWCPHFPRRPRRRARTAPRPRRKLGVADLRLASASTGWTLVRPPTAVRVAKRRVCRLAVAQRSHPQLGDRADHRRRIAPPQLGLGPGQRHARSAGTPPISGASVSDQEFPPV